MNHYEFTITAPDFFKESITRKLFEVGTLGVFERNNDLVAYFPESFDIANLILELDLVKALLDRAASGPGQGVTYRYSLLPDTDWNESWKKEFTPLDVGERFTILPPWETPRQGRTNLIIDPGMAFGTGHHETTRSCLLFLEKHAETSARDRFLDLGTGTGILAIAASFLGFREIVGVDTDPLAIEASRRNASLNDLENITFLKGTIESVEGLFPLITANLFSGILINIAMDIASHVSPYGSAIISGMIEGQEQEVGAAFERAGLRVIDSLYDGKWVTLAVSR